MHNHYSDFYSKLNYKYNLPDQKIPYHLAVPTLWPCRNLSSGYHSILIDYIHNHIDTNKNIDVLLISENHLVKEDFNKIYPLWNIKTVNFYKEISTEQVDSDIIANICDRSNNELRKYKFNLIINQATLEHVYDPFGAMYNLCEILDKDGIIVNHTHAPDFGYHQYPRDYIRFMKDWWYDIPSYIPNIELLELFMHQNMHVFTCYKKI